jgi:hypothetical protein
MIVLSVAGLVACRTGGYNTPPPRTVTSPPPGGVPESEMPPTTSTRKGVMVPSDTGIGGGPPGVPNNTGTNGRAVGPTLGSPGNGN